MLGFHNKSSAKVFEQVDHLHILFRSCTRVHAVHGGERPFGATKSQIVLCSLQSIVDAVSDACTIHVMDDHSESSDVAAMKRLLARHSQRHQFVSLDKTGNGESMEANFRYARDNDFPMIYFCEDDYLHTRDAISLMVDFYENFPKECLLHPTDYMDRYTRGAYASCIYLGKERHWRTIQHTTGTFMMSQNILQKYWDLYLKFALINKKSSGGEDASINKIYQREVCVSPMPSLAAHISPDPPLPAYVDWQGLFRQVAQSLSLEEKNHKREVV